MPNKALAVIFCKTDHGVKRNGHCSICEVESNGHIVLPGERLQENAKILLINSELVNITRMPHFCSVWNC